MSKNPNRTDDGRRHMPKKECPYCGKRTIDFCNTGLWINTDIYKYKTDGLYDMVINCSNCKNPIGIKFKTDVA